MQPERKFNSRHISNINKTINPEKVMPSVRRNAHLESLAYNPGENLLPVNENEVKKRMGSIGPNELPSKPPLPRKTRALEKIDDTLLSNMAKRQNAANFG